MNYSEAIRGYRDVLRRYVDDGNLVASNESAIAMANGSLWNVYGRGVDGYAEDWHMSPFEIRKMVDAYRNDGIEPFVLDLGSDTSFLEDLDVHGVAVGLVDPRKARGETDNIAKLEARGISMVSGNVLIPDTWKCIDDRLEQEKRTGFDMVFSAARGGFDYIPELPAVHRKVLDRVWSRLNLNGQLVMNMPNVYRGEDHHHILLEREEREFFNLDWSAFANWLAHMESLAKAGRFEFSIDIGEDLVLPRIYMKKTDPTFGRIPK